MSESWYINSGNFMYGASDINQPCVPCYDKSFHHKIHGLRDFPNNSIRDDGLPYKAYIPQPKCCVKCNKCNGINRNLLITNFVNIETSINKILTVKLYGINKSDDKTIKMTVGSKYCITYLTENGLVTATGILREISSGIPDECTRYIGNFSFASTAAYIAFDCSTDGTSDKRLIYIASIRYIEPLFDETDDQFPDMSLDEKLNSILTKIDLVTEIVNEYKTALEEAAENTEESSDNNQQQEDHNCNCNHDKPEPPHPEFGPFSRPGPYQGPLIVGQRHPYPPAMGYGPGRPGIMDKEPPKCHRECNKCKEKEDNKLSAEDLLNSLAQIKTLLNSYIAEQNTISRNDLNDCGCDLGVPVVNNVPHDAMDKDLYIIEDTDNNTDNNP